jgi:hypothetical protein
LERQSRNHSAQQHRSGRIMAGSPRVRQKLVNI